MDARLLVFGVALALCAVSPQSSAEQTPQSVLDAKSAGRCITLQEAFIGFGEQTTRGDAFRKLDEAIAILRLRRPRYATAKERSRSAICEIYIKALNEFECKARATLCR